MSHEAFADFYTKFLESPAGEKARAQFDGVTDHKAFCAMMVKAGAAAGFQFTAEEVMSVMQASEAKAAKALAQASGELSEDQLEGVVGGASLSYSVPTVQIGSYGGGLRLPDMGSVASTVMCPW